MRTPPGTPPEEDDQPTATSIPSGPTMTPPIQITDDVPLAFEGCIKFDELASGIVYVVDDKSVTSDVAINVEDFTYNDGPTTSSGTAEIVSGGNAGGSGQEINANNVNLAFEFGGPVAGLKLRYGARGNNRNININGDFVNFGSFAEIDGHSIGGVDITITDLGNGLGILELSGPIDSFTIDGEELFIDDLCFEF